MSCKCSRDILTSHCSLFGQFGHDQKFWQKKGINKADILSIKLKPILDYVRGKLERIPIKDLAQIVYGIGFVYIFQKQNLEASAKDLLADINGENLLKAWIGEKRQQNDDGKETRVKKSMNGVKH